MNANALVSCAAGSNLAPPPPSLALRADEFHAWLENARPGARIEYHRGFLPLDCDRGFSPFGEKHRRELMNVATRAAALAGTGHVLLAQQRHGPCDYSYFAVRPTRRPRDPKNTCDREGR